MTNLVQLHASALDTPPDDAEIVLGVASGGTRVFAALKAAGIIPAGDGSGRQLLLPSGIKGQSSLATLSASFAVTAGVISINYASTVVPGVIKVDGTTITLDSQGVASAAGGGGGSLAVAGTDNPVMNGTVNVGTSTKAARADHVHPSDISREATANKNQPNGYAGLDSSARIPVSAMPAAVLGAMNYQGTWNALTNNPTLTSGTGSKGFFYTVATAGTTAVDGISQWNVGDKILFNGTAWEKLDGLANEVISVVGLTGVVTATQIATALGLSPLATLAPGTSGFVLQSNGPGSTPIWVAPAGGSSGALTVITIDGVNPVGSTASPYQMQTGDRVIDVNKTTGAATKVLLPTSPTVGVRYTIIDGKGDAGTNNITIAGTSVAINGQATFVIDGNNYAIDVVAVNATTWRIV